jgi:hypothetical protein
VPGYDAETLGLKTAKAWGLTPRQWRDESTDDQALMLAFELFEGARDGYRDEYREAYNEKHGAAGGKKNREGDREFQGMQRAKQLEKRGGLTPGN